MSAEGSETPVETAAPPTRLSAAPRARGADAAAAGARRVLAALIDAGADAGVDLDAVAGQLNALADELTAKAPAREERLVQLWEGEGVTRHDPVTGPENPVAPPLALYGYADGSIGGTVTLDLPYQGPPGFVHGGVSALLIDHTLGVANHWAGLSGMTARLTLHYRQPVPLFEELTVTGEQLAVDGRKIQTVGAITAGGVECVTAEALFIAKQLDRPR